MVDFPSRWRLSPQSTKSTPAMTAIANAIGMGESEYGHFHPKKVGAWSVDHQP